MTPATTPPKITTSITPGARFGFALTRLVVPLWVLAGAVFKLIEHTPKNLPTQIWQRGIDFGIDLHVLLATLIIIEFIMAALMLFVPRLARVAAITMLSVFVAVLLNEMRTGNFSDCGCLGKIPVKPWQMLTIDSLLLIGVIVFGRNVPSTSGRRMNSPLGAVGLSLAGIVGCALWVLPERARSSNSPSSSGDGTVVIKGENPANSAETSLATNPDITPPIATQPEGSGTAVPWSSTDPQIPGGAVQGAVPSVASAGEGVKNPSPLPPVPSWYAQDIEGWVGKPWRELDLFKFMPTWPTGLDEAKRYVVFYSRTCEHCRDMFLDDLLIPLDAPITAIEIPQSRTVMTDPDGWPMPAYKHIEHAALPVGTTLWMITPPLALRLENGVVTCATEGEHKRCLGIP